MKRRVALRLLLVPLAAALLFELALRVVLFADVADDWRLARELRRPDLFAHAMVDDLYWELQHEFRARERQRPAPPHDPLLGWRCARLRAGDRRHVDAGSVGERRPVLLYGDSYAECAVAPGGCFEDALEQHPLGAAYRILNHGVGGYGLDQVALLLDATVDAWLEREPLVVVGVLVDGDLDRCALSVRGRPKPRLERVNGAWSFEPEPLPEDVRVAAPRATSYGLRLLLHGPRFVPAGLHDALCSEAERTEHNLERCAAILAWIASGLERRGLDSFFLLFHRSDSLEDPGATGWREPFLSARLDELGLPWVSTRGPLLAHAAASGRPTSDYYQENDHLNALGNHAAFRALAQGLEGHFGDDFDASWGEAELLAPLGPEHFAEVLLGGPKAAARYEYGWRPPFTSGADRSRLCFRAAKQGPTEVRYELRGRARAFEASARLMPVGALGPGEGSVGLTLLVDGAQRVRHVVRRGDSPLALAIELEGSDSLILRVDDAGDGIRGDWLVLSGPTFLARSGR